MRSSGPSKWRFRRGAITGWKKLVPVLDSERLGIALSDLEVFREKFNVLPRLEDAFNMFRMIMPQDVRVVIIAQSPYPGSCPATKIPYACGPAFLPSPGCETTPATLRNVVSEVYRSYPNKARKLPKVMLLDWIDQGVMLLNSSLTLGTGCPKYLEDHSVLWKEIMQDIVCTISEHLDPIFVLVGRDAWELGSSVLQKSTERMIKVSHPVARKETSTPWLGSGVFSRVSDMMVERGEMPIRWG
jgi:uracil DNA glycosylase